MLVKVDADYPVRSGRDDHVRHELCSDRHARLVLAVLPRVAVVRHHTRNASSRCPLCRVDQEQKLHDVLGRRVCRLQDENVVATNVLVYADEDLTISKPRDRRFGRVHSEGSGDLLGESGIARSNEKLQSVTRYG
jgi:hypothetical protein